MDVAVALERLRPYAASLAILVDYDGTLAPIVADPEAAVPLPGMLDRLREIVAGGVRCAVVSGRPVEFLRRMVAIEGSVLVGQYGLERDAAGATVPDPRAAAFAPAVRAATAEADRAFAHLYVEPKGDLAVTVHWRAAGVIDDGELAEIAAIATRHGLWIHATRMARELRVPVPVDKGSAVTALLAELGCRAALFAGDDAGDVVAFDSLDRACESGVIESGLKVGVWSPEAPGELIERADVIVDGPTGVLAMLDALAD